MGDVAVKVRYKKNGQTAFYDSQWMPTAPREPPSPLTGPFERCGGCPYPNHGFVCWGCDGETCLRTEVAQIMRAKSVASAR